MVEFEPVEVLGLVAGTLTTISFLPQVISVWKTKKVEDISLAMFVIFVAGVALWIVYGSWIMSWSVLIANIVTIVLAGMILVGKLKYDPPKWLRGKLCFGDPKNPLTGIPGHLQLVEQDDVHVVMDDAVSKVEMHDVQSSESHTSAA
mgnify:CR=1 FL=1